MHVCVHMYIGACECGACVSWGGQRLRAVTFSAYFPPHGLWLCPVLTSASELLVLLAGYHALMAFYIGTGDLNPSPHVCVASIFLILSHLPRPQSFLSEAASEVFCHSNKKEAKRVPSEECAIGCPVLRCAVLCCAATSETINLQWEKVYISCNISAFTTWSAGPLLLSLW